MIRTHPPTTITFFIIAPRTERASIRTPVAMMANNAASIRGKIVCLIISFPNETQTIQDLILIKQNLWRKTYKKISDDYLSLLTQSN
jgi:hypothetical protein